MNLLTVLFLTAAPLLTHGTVVYHHATLDYLHTANPHIIYTTAPNRQRLTGTHRCIPDPDGTDAILCSPRQLLPGSSRPDRLHFNKCAYLFKPPSDGGDTQPTQRWYAYQMATQLESHSPDLTVVSGPTLSITDPSRISKLPVRLGTLKKGGVMESFEAELAKRGLAVVSLFGVAWLLWWLVYGRRPRAAFMF